MFVFCGGVILGTAIGTAVWQSGGATAGDRMPSRGALANWLPRHVPNTIIRDVPLSPGEGVDAIAREKLDYDDILYREYRTSRGSFFVYEGYWARGKRSPSHFSAHTLVRCCVLAGMSCLEMRSDWELSAKLIPGHWRRFRQPDRIEIETVYWHLVGRKRLVQGPHSQPESALLMSACAGLPKCSSHGKINISSGCIQPSPCEISLEKRRSNLS